MIKINCIGKLCPTPVIETRNALKNTLENNTIQISVDNFTAVENLKKMVSQLGFIDGFKFHKISNELYEVTIVKGTGNLIVENENNENKNIVVISSNTMGDGDETLGTKLLEGFIYSLTEQDIKPKKIIFYNKGVFLPTQNKKIIEDLKILENNNCEILGCGLCLDFYNLKDEFLIGSVTNMYQITTLLMSNEKIIYIG